MSLKSPVKALNPDFSLEDELGVPVCGIDEVGRGPLAGPVVAACVFIPPKVRDLEWIAHIRDSKKLSEKKLEMLFGAITAHCVYGIAEITPNEIDRINILQASLRAMERAYQACGKFDHALVDGNKLPKLPCPASAIIKGDGKSKSIAAASIIAKVTRDRIMRKLAEEFPHYGWESNVGYPSKAHRDAILIHGITPHHRRSFAPVKKFLEKRD